MTRPWMPIYWGDYTKKTQHLSTLEHGAYLLLIAHYWNTGKPILNDSDTLRRITRTSSKQWNQIAKTLLQFFNIKDGFLVHDRVESELQTTLVISTLQSSRAERGWKTRKNQRVRDASGIHGAMPITTTTTISKVDKSTSDIFMSETAKQFDVFWQAYPKNGASRKSALESFTKAINKGANHDDIIRGATAYSGFITAGSKREFTAHATTWLNQERWTIDYTELARSTGQTSSGVQAKPTFASEGKRLQDECRAAAEAEQLADDLIAASDLPDDERNDALSRIRSGRPLVKGSCAANLCFAAGIWKDTAGSRDFSEGVCDVSRQSAIGFDTKSIQGVDENQQPDTHPI